MVIAGSASITALSSSFFKGLEKTSACAILAAARIQKISAKQPISSEGDQATRLFLLQSGRARCYHLTEKGQLVVLTWLVPGDVTGLVATLESPPPYMVTTEAITNCEVLTWGHPVVRKLVSSHPLLAENALRISLSYLRTFIDSHIQLVSSTAKGRLATTLLSLSDRLGQFHPEGIKVCATNDELGELANTSRFTASRVLKSWERAGTLSRGRRSVVIRAPEALMID
jgi:CRP-like cAMP-binding protein